MYFDFKEEALFSLVSNMESGLRLTFANMIDS